MLRHKTFRTMAPVHRAPRGLQRILVALDGTPGGETILDHLQGILAPRSMVILIHVIPTPPPSSGPQLADLFRAEEETELYLEKVQARFPQMRSRWIVETGDPAERILAAARDEDADALAMTSHSRGRLTSLFIGSVAHEVVRRAGRPVFLVRPDVPLPRRTRRRILVPLGGPEDAETVLRAVESLAKRTESEVVLLHVLPEARVADPVTGFNPIVLRPIQLPEVEWLDPLVDHLAHHGVRTVKTVLVGEPDEIVLRESRAQNVDLIAFQTRGRGGFARLILGGVTEKVLKKTDRAVLLFHRVEE